MSYKYLSTRLGKVQAIVVVASLLASFFVGFVSPAAADTSDLFFSEYVEGSSYNKALEIYNGTGAAVDLSAYTLELYSNGAAAPSQSTALSGTLADGDVYVIAHTSADAAILVVADATNGSVVNFNGDDAVVLKGGATVVDVIGQVGFDPGSEWGSGDASTANNTIRRQADVCAGDTNPSDAFDPAAEWDGYANDTFDGLGAHTANCGTSLPDVIINEVDADQVGTDSAEFVELYDGGMGNTDLTGLVLVLFNGSDDASYEAFDLDGQSTDANGYFVLCGDAGNVANCDLDVSPDTNLIQNGADAVALYQGDAVDFPEDTPVSTTNLLDAIVYDTNDGDDAGLLVLLNAGQPQVNERDGGDGTGHSNQRCPNGEGGARNTDTYTQVLPTPGAANDCPLPHIVINEVDADQVGTDSAEFVELYDGGMGNTDLTGLVLVLFNGSDDASYEAFDLDGQSTDANGYFVLCGDAGNVANCDLDVSPDTNLIQNGADAVALYQGDAVDFPEDTPVSTTNLLDAIVYDTNDGDDAGLLVLLNAGQPQVNERDGGDGTAHSNQRCPNGEGGARNTDTYTQVLPTPGAANDCPVPVTTIYEIQYTTDPSGDSPFKNQSGITTEGIVTALFYNGYFIEGPAGGAWSGLWVYDSSTPALGDYVRVTGTVVEYHNFTELSSLTGYEVVSSGNSLPAPVVLSTSDVSQEQWEGVLVRVESVTVINDSLGHGEWSVNDGSGDVVIDDKGSYTYAPTAGDFIDAITGVLDYSHGAFKIQPRDDNDIFVCGDPATFIHNIQGNGASSPEVGNIHVIEGVVVGDFQTSSHLRGFFLQEEDADADTDPMTSEGIFVYDGSYPAVDVNVGDVVRVMGTVAEYYDLTELTSITNIAVCDPGVATAATVNLPVSSLDVWEQYEGMLIHIPQTLYATGNYNQGRYGEVDLSVGDRLDTPTNVVAPGAPALALQELNDRSRIQLEDGSTAQNPSPAPYIGDDNTLRAGDTIPGLTGVLHYSFGAYELHPTEAVNFTRVNERTAAPPDVGGVLKVASFNVLNYFSTIDTGAWICGPSGDMECRGADSEEEFTRQRNKIIAAVVTMDADVIGLMEMENHPTDAALQDLVSGLNDAAGAGIYAYVDTGTIGTDAIKVAFIYKPGTVTPVGSFAILDSSVDETFIDTKNRPALAQTFRHTTDEIFTVVVNHLKSKGSDCNDLGDPDTGDGQGNCNLTRTSAAIALANWLGTDPTGSGDPDYLIIGDLNAYAMEDPITAIKDAGYTNLIESFVGADAYSYVFYGQAGYLDHALASADLTSRVMGVTEWHINADEPSALNYNNYNQPDLYQPDAYCSSDHDPVIVGICDAVPPEVEVSVTPDTLWPPNHEYVTVNAIVNVSDNADPNVTLMLLSVTSNEPDDGLGDGDMPDDIVIVDDFTFELRAERSDSGDGRIYTITYQVTDACGNSTVATATVTVPHDQG